MEVVCLLLRSTIPNDFGFRNYDNNLVYKRSIPAWNDINSEIVWMKHFSSYNESAHYVSNYVCSYVRMFVCACVRLCVFMYAVRGCDIYILIVSKLNMNLLLIAISRQNNNNNRQKLWLSKQKKLPISTSSYKRIETFTFNLTPLPFRTFFRILFCIASNLLKLDRCTHERE